MSQNDGSPTIGQIVGLEAYASELADHYAGFDVAMEEAVLIANGFRKPASRAQGERAMLIAKGQIEPAKAQTKRSRRQRHTPTLTRGYNAMLEEGVS